MSLNPSLFGRTAAVVRQRGYVLDHGHFNSGLSQRPDRALATGTRAFHIHFHPSQTGFERYFGGIGGGHLGGVRSILFGTPETHFTRGGPTDHLSLLVGQSDDDIVE